MSRFAEVLRAEQSPARVRALLLDELRRGREELARPRSGYPEPVVVALGPGPGPEPAVRGVAPVDAALRVDPAVAGERAWLVVAALIGALVEAGADRVDAGDQDGFLVLGGGGHDLELAALAFAESVAGVDRLRVEAFEVGPEVVDGGTLRPALGTGNPIAVAAQVALLGGNPADPASVAALEEAVYDAQPPVRPHDDPDPARRVARRILQRLAGMGKWGGYHTDVTHLKRGFASHDQDLAARVGESLLEAGLLLEKPSVGQRHVFLNPRRKSDIDAFVADGTRPRDLRLP